VLGLATAAEAQEADTDLPLLLAELAGQAVDVVVWDDPGVDWAAYGAVVIRSTWDYHARREDFLAWTRRVAEVTRLWNPPEVVAWNTDKRYLADLAAAGLPVVPTTFVAPGAEADAHVLRDDVVIKPTVGAGSRLVVRSLGDVSIATGHVADLHAVGRTAMIQPYLSQIDDRGETGLVYVGGEFSHAFRKSAILSRPVRWESELFAEEIVGPRVASVAERELGERVMASVPPVAYARVDLLPTAEGPVLLELELTEPSLFLECDPGAAARAAAAFRELLV
jgi:glutathione synthase/RimK-type ligase-like ATP-grasp enzyme